MITHRATVLAVVAIACAGPWLSFAAEAARMTGARNAFLDLFENPSDSAPKKTLHKADVTSCTILQVNNGMLQVDCAGGRFWVNRTDVVTDDIPAAKPCEGSSRVGAPRNMGSDCP